MTGEHLDLASDPDDQTPREKSSIRFLGVQFACCGVYARVYLNRERTAYVGHCPKCSRPVRVRIDPNGTQERFFTAY